MKSLIVFLLLSLCHNTSFAGVDGWRMNQFTGKPDYYQTGVDSTTVEAIAVSTSALAVQTAALSVSTAANAVRIASLESSTSTLKTRVDALEVSTATLDSTLSAEIQVRQELATQVAIDTTAIGGVSLSAYNEFTSSNSFSSILIASGTHGLGDDLTAAGAGSRFFFYPKKSAIRAGRVTDTKWDDANIGNYSIGMGYQAHTSGEGSVNLGYGNTVYSQYGGSFAGSGNVVGSAGTGSNSVALGGNGNHVNDTAGTSGATIAGNELSVETDFSVCVGGQTNAVNGAGTHSVTLGGSNVTVSGTKSGAGGEWVQNAADHSFAWGRYVGLSDAADASIIFGYDSTSVKTYTESGKFYIHGLDLRVSSSTTAAVQYGLTKEGAATVDTLISKSTATLAALSVTGQGNITGPINISTATITGYIDSAIVMVSSTCLAPSSVATTCTAACPSGKYALSGGYNSSSSIAPHDSHRESDTQWRTIYNNAVAAYIITYVYCGRLK